MSLIESISKPTFQVLTHEVKLIKLKESSMGKFAFIKKAIHSKVKEYKKESLLLLQSESYKISINQRNITTIIDAWLSTACSVYRSIKATPWLISLLYLFPSLSWPNSNRLLKYVEIFKDTPAPLYIHLSGVYHRGSL